MIDTHRENEARALRRLLANGPLDGVPRRPTDQDLLVRLAAATLEEGREYSERDLNDHLRTWLATFTEPYGVDHVTLRRMLVDSRRLSRTKSGSLYVVDSARNADAEGLRDIQPADVLEAVRREREARKREAQARSG